MEAIFPNKTPFANYHATNGPWYSGLEQATADCVATWKRLELKSQPFAPADWKHKPQHMSCSHALSTKEKEKAPGQQKVP